MANPNIAEYGKNTQFQKGVVTNPAGRPPNRLRRLVKESGFTEADLKAVIETLFRNYNFEEIQAILANNTGSKNKIKVSKEFKELVEEEGQVEALSTALMALYMKAVGGDVRALAYFTDRMFGKPTQHVESTNTSVVADLTKEDRIKLIEDILKKSESRNSKNNRPKSTKRK